MDLGTLNREITQEVSKLHTTPDNDDRYKQLTGNIRALQELELKEREMRIKEAELEYKKSCDESRAESERIKQATYSREIDTRVADLAARERNDRRQAILAYTKIIVGTAGTVGSILLVAACEEERVLRSKGFQYVKNFAMRFL